MFCLCNGKELKIFRTDFAPKEALVKAFVYENFNTELDAITKMLSPDAIRKTWPIIEIDCGKRLGKGLPSFVQVVGGTFDYTSIGSPHPLMRGLQTPVLADLLFTIVSGFVERSNDKLRAVVITRSASHEGQRISESIGMDRMELWSDAVQISDNPSEPTSFSYTATYPYLQLVRVCWE